jgi:hypothetical protein
MDYFIVSCLIAEVLILSQLDKKVFGTWVTPFNLLAYPYMVVAVSAFLFAPSLDFVSLYAPSVLVWIVGLFLFWGTGFILGLLFGFREENRSAWFTSRSSPADNSVTKLATKVAWAIVPFMAFGLYRAQAATGGWSEIGSYEFKVAYVHGLPAHAVQLAQPLAVYLIGSYRKRSYFQVVTIVVLLLFLFLTFVKGTFLSTIIAAMIFQAMRQNLKVPIKKIVTVLGISYVVFNAVYLVGFAALDPSNLIDSSNYGYLARHYMYYLWAGVLSFGHALQTGVGMIGGPWYLLLAPFINIYRAALGAGSVLVALSPEELGMDVDLAGLSSASPFAGSNVYTMLGTLYFYMGALGAALVLIAFAILCYGLLLICQRRHNDWFLALYCIFGSWLVFGFFDYYFASLGFPETIVDCLLLAALVKWVTNRRGESTLVGTQSKLTPHPL